jgi:hypothetical protein
MKSQLLTYLKEYNNSYLPVLNERDLDKRLMLDSNSDDL